MMKLFFLLIACVLLGLLVTLIDQPETVRLRFGVHAYDSPATLALQYDPLFLELERRLAHELNADVRIDITFTKDSADTVDAIKTGRIDFGRTSSAAYLAATSDGDDLRLIGIEIQDDRGLRPWISASHTDHEVPKRLSKYLSTISDPRTWRELGCIEFISVNFLQLLPTHSLKT